MNMEKTKLDGALLIKPRLFEDNRGYFFESYNKKCLAGIGINDEFVQDNVSYSKRGILRGLHFQIKHTQAKLVRCMRGEVFDAIVDLRMGSPTYLQWFGVVLSEQNNLILYVPKGFAHGYLALSDEAVFLYKCSDFYDPASESGFIWNDPAFSIKWPVDGEPILSSKDKELLRFTSERNPFVYEIGD